ncbi:MAG: sugar ABC transporter ATP-binding protein [Chitinophagaceae bacterium]|nr:MAG: sugar ABC transporter ATP-binding protein [Chitinophagaceae bacterium]
MLVAENITKKFPGVIALHEVSMQLYPGKVNAIVGENGAGKSTLMKILSGIYSEYEGRILLNNQPVNFANPREAQHAGIGIIHQELNLIPHLNITENIFLGREITNKWGMLDGKAMQVKTQQLLDKLNLKMSPTTLIYELKVGQQQIVEIAKALLSDCSVLIMDEPTSAISESEVEILFGIIEELKRENKVIVYISHKLDELFKIADHYIVLRDGKTIEAGEMKAITHNLLIQKMVGREIEVLRNKGFKTEKEPVLTIANLSLANPVNPQKELLKDLSFHLYPGEVLGIFGLMGAGRTELLETIFGLHKNGKTGRISINQKEVDFKSPAAAMQAGISLVPEDRKKDGLLLGLDVKANIAITTLHDLQQMGILSSTRELTLAKKYIDSLRIKTPSANQLVKNLSGGNQQKIVLAKCLATSPIILMLDEPTRGIDINAKNEIYKLIMEFAASGMGVIMVSSELPEILAIADRVLVMSEGRIKATFNAENATEDKILNAALSQTIS